MAFTDHYDPPIAPKRRNRLTMDIHADSLDELRTALENIVFELREEGNQSTSGSPSWGGHFEHVVDAEQTSERYREQLAAYLEALKRERET